MNKLQRLGAIGAVTLLTLGAAIGCKSPGWHDSPEEHINHIFEEVDEELELNEAQRQQLSQLRQLVNEQATRIGNEREMRHERFNALIASERLDRQGAQAIVDEHLGRVRTEAPRFIEALGNFYDSLNPEQQANIRERAIEHQQGGHCRRWLH